MFIIRPFSIMVTKNQFPAFLSSRPYVFRIVWVFQLKKSDKTFYTTTISNINTQHKRGGTAVVIIFLMHQFRRLIKHRFVIFRFYDCILFSVFRNPGKMYLFQNVSELLRNFTLVIHLTSKHFPQ